MQGQKRSMNKGSAWSAISYSHPPGTGTIDALMNAGRSFKPGTLNRTGSSIETEKRDTPVSFVGSCLLHRITLSGIAAANVNVDMKQAW